MSRLASSGLKSPTIAKVAWLEGRRRFIAVGGDGTGFEIVNGLFPAAQGASDRPRLGFLPMGTGNSFLRDFTGAVSGPQAGAEHSIAALLGDRAPPCGVARVHHRNGVMHWVNILSIGFVALGNGLRHRLRIARTTPINNSSFHFRKFLSFNDFI